jgi:hypothetical protein
MFAAMLRLMRSEAHAITEANAKLERAARSVRR